MEIGCSRARIERFARIAQIATLATLGACKSGEEQGAPIAAPDLQVVSAGAEPRQLLRYHPTPGTTQKLEVGVALQLEAGEMGGPMPSIVMTLAIRVDALLPTRQSRLHVTIESVEGRDAPESKVPASSLDATLAPMKGIGFDATLSANGRLSSTTLDPASQSLPAATKTTFASLVSSFEQTMMPLPDTPVGRGAVWRNTRPVTPQGMALTAVNSVSLAIISGSSIALSTDATLHGDDQKVTEGDNSVDVTDITGSSAGKVTIDLASLAVTSDTLAELHTSMLAAGDPAPTKLTMVTRTVVQPR